MIFHFALSRPAKRPKKIEKRRSEKGVQKSIDFVIVFGANIDVKIDEKSIFSLSQRRLGASGSKTLKSTTVPRFDTLFAAARGVQIAPNSVQVPSSARASHLSRSPPLAGLVLASQTGSLFDPGFFKARPGSTKIARNPEKLFRCQLFQGPCCDPSYLS